MSRPVVVIEALSIRDRSTGVGQGAVELLRELAGRDRGLDFVVVAGSGTPLAWLADRPGWRLCVAGGPRRGPREWARQVMVPALCRDVGASALHCLQPVAAFGAPCPVLLTVHDLAWRTMPEVIDQPRRSWLRAVIPPSLRRSSLLLANSEATATALRREFPPQAPRVRSVPHGTPGWALAKAASGAGGARAAQPGRRPFFLFVGTMEPRKNLPRLLDAYELLVAGQAASCPDLCLAGPPGWGLGAVRERLAHPSLAGRVRVMGWCDDATLRELYDTALALVFPSLDEGFGLPILEAMACRLPVLTADRTATAEVAGAAALLVDPLSVPDIAAAMAALAADPGLRARLAAAGASRVAAWTWARTAELTAAAYAEVLAGHLPK